MEIGDEEITCPDTNLSPLRAAPRAEVDEVSAGPKRKERDEDIEVTVTITANITSEPLVALSSSTNSDDNVLHSSSSSKTEVKKAKISGSSDSGGASKFETVARVSDLSNDEYKWRKGYFQRFVANYDYLKNGPEDETNYIKNGTVVCMYCNTSHHVQQYIANLKTHATSQQ
jgi:hypothetical protein